MVSPIPPSPPPSPLGDSPPSDTLQDEHHPYVEQHFPRQMSWYAPEGPQGFLEAGSRLIRENPYRSLAIAAGVGLLLALLSRPAARTSMAGARTLLRSRRDSSRECAD